jgi:hypothetical protein
MTFDFAEMKLKCAVKKEEGHRGEDAGKDTATE